MNAERTQLVESLFYEAVELDDTQLDDFLITRCGSDLDLKRSVLSLLERDRALESSEFLEQSPGQPGSLLCENSTMNGVRLGAFKLVEHLGSGGMGDVYLGVRDDEYCQQAAIKLIRVGKNSDKIAKRFRREMQFLAALGKHPCITSILDAGVTESGQLYIAMEYVNGQRISSFCDEQELPIRERLELFCKACDAVQFAHQNAILHRDLKPSNLLVTEDGRPILIDFGVAKVLADETDRFSPQTKTQQHAYTLGYSSPEQINCGMETTASDVYSLGVILYELLTGHQPHASETGSLAETVRAICESDPTKPSMAVLQQARHSSEQSPVSPAQIARARNTSDKQLSRTLHGDLDCILMKAVARDAKRRYKTVEQFAGDIQRFLDGKPVKAQPDSFGYRTQKFVRRNALAVAAGAAVMVVLLTAIGITSRMALVASNAAAAEQKQAARAKAAAQAEKEQRILAEKQERSANEVIELFDHFMASADPRKTGDPNYPARQLLEAFAQDLQTSNAQDPIVEARLLHSLASALKGLGDYRSARIHAEKAIAVFSEHLGAKHRLTLAGKVLLAQIALLNQSAGAAELLSRRVTEMDTATQDHDAAWNLIQVNALTVLAEAERRRDNLDASETALVLAEGKISLIGAMARSEAKVKLERTRTQLLVARGKLDEALVLAKSGYEDAEERFGISDYRTSNAGDLLASIYLAQRRFDEAVALYESSYRIARKLFGEDSQVTLLRVMRLAHTQYLAGNYAAADTYFRTYESLHTALRRYEGRHHHGLLVTWSECLSELGKSDEAEQLLHRCYEFYLRGNRKGEDFLRVQNRIVAILRDKGQDKLADAWSLPPEVPVPTDESHIRVDPTGEVTLVVSDFAHSANDMQHYATHWQIRAAGETYKYSPTLDITTTDHRTQLTVPAGILLPDQQYFWRVAHVGQNRLQSAFSNEKSLQTGKLHHEMRPIDLTQYFNRDVVHSPRDDSEDAFHPETKQLVIDGYRPISLSGGLSKEEYRGVPQDRIIGPHRLGDYQDHNAIQLDTETHRVDIALNSGTMSSLRILLGSFLNARKCDEESLTIVLNYADGTQEELRVPCPDWKVKTYDSAPDSRMFPPSIVRNGMDQCFICGAAVRANNALFDAMLPVDSSRRLTEISILANDDDALDPGARINILAITAVAHRSQPSDSDILGGNHASKVGL